jgi:DNA-binding CsgD family transcriptional regulator
VIGREQERVLIDRLLGDARTGRSGVLLLHGEPGVGKSALLGYALERAEDFHLLQVTGVETEIALAFAGLDQLVRPVLPLAPRLPPRQADALLGALGLSDHVSSDRFLVAAATLSLLSESAEDGPVLCVVDDAHWLDQPSSEVLSFAARRLEAEGVVLLAATRGEPWSGLHSRSIGGLGSENADELLRERGFHVTRDVLARLLEETGGNALALMELAASLSSEQLEGAAPLPRPLRLTPRIEQAFGVQIRKLPEATQTLLLVAAADDTGDLSIVFRAAASLDVDPDALEAAEEAALTKIDGTGRIVFRHPLVRGAVYQGATFTRRTRVHRALAGVLDGEHHVARRAWHLAATAIGPDEHIAHELGSSAELARQRGGYAVAATAFERAGELSASSSDRARFLVAAAQAAFQSGDADRAAGLADLPQHLVSDPVVADQLAVLQGRIEFARGSSVAAHALLMQAARRIVQRDVHAAAAVLVEAARAAWSANDLDRLTEAATQLAELKLAPDDPLAGLVSTTIAIADFFAGRTADAVGGLRRGLDAWQRVAVAGGGVAHEPELVDAALAVVGYTRVTGDDAAGLTLGASVVDECRQRGWAAWLPWALANLSLTEAVAGRHAAAIVSATEGLRLARDLAQPASICRCESVLAWLAAVRGEEDRCRQLAEDVIRLADSHQLATIAVSATWALGLLDLSLGRPDQAFDRLSDPTTGPLAVPQFICLFLPDLAEAAARAGRTDDLGDFMASYESWAGATAQPLVDASLHRCRALLDNASAGHHYAEAVRLFEQAGPDARPFDRARTQLLYGEWLRRARRRVDARKQLVAAFETFQRLQAGPWADRARAELRASGQRLRRRDETRAHLTPQELRVVRLVAEGDSNHEVAAKLFLSPRTVGYHLYKAFPKLGVTSRTELAHLDLDAILTTE